MSTIVLSKKEKAEEKIDACFDYDRGRMTHIL